MMKEIRDGGVRSDILIPAFWIVDSWGTGYWYSTVQYSTVQYFSAQLGRINRGTLRGRCR